MLFTVLWAVLVGALFTLGVLWVYKDDLFKKGDKRE